MKHRFHRAWPLSAVAGALNAVMAVLYLSMWVGEGPVAFLTWSGVVVLLGKLALLSAACTIAAAFWGKSDPKRWPLLLHGFALGALGVVQYGLTGISVSILTVMLLVVVMALSLGAIDRARGQSLTAVASLGFAALFLALGFRWIGGGPGDPIELLCLGVYFVFSAICFLMFAARPLPSDIVGGGLPH